MAELPWEDNLLERKLESDLKDLLKTLVAFANSVKPSHVAVILIGERDDGGVSGVTNPDNIQRKVREECDKIYPAILWRSSVYEKEGKQCVRVELEYSGDTPHFGGPAWIRKGSETIKASDEVFQRLIDVRTHMIRELTQWIGREVTVQGEEGSIPPPRLKAGVRYIPQTVPASRTHQFFQHRWPGTDTSATLLSVNRFWITVERKDTGKSVSEPLRKLTLSFDDENNRLRIIVAY
jgi:hypothetical protein